MKPKAVLRTAFPSANRTHSKVEISFENMTCKYHNFKLETHFPDNACCQVNFPLLLQYLLFNVLVVVVVDDDVVNLF